MIDLLQSADPSLARCAKHLHHPSGFIVWPGQCQPIYIPHLFTTPDSNEGLILSHCPVQGMYTCVAKNVVGKAYVAAYLQVAGSPHLYLEWVAVVLFVFYRQLSLNIVGAK